MLLDPFEEQFDLPSALIKLCDGQRGQEEVVGQEHERFAGVCVVEFDAAQLLGISEPRVFAIEDDNLVAAQTRGFVHGMGIEPSKQGFGARSDDKEGRALVSVIEAAKIDVSAVHDIEGSGFGEPIRMTGPIACSTSDRMRLAMWYSRV